LDVKLGISLSLSDKLRDWIENKVVRKIFGTIRYKEQWIKNCKELNDL
jgi:hypothetical protein